MASPATNIQQEVLGLEKQYRDAMQKRDSATIERLTANPCLVVGGQGVSTIPRNQLAGMMTSEFQLKSYKMDEANATFKDLGNGAVAIAYRVHEDFDRAGKNQRADFYDSSVWIKKGNAWECAVHTESPVEGR